MDRSQKLIHDDRSRAQPLVQIRAMHGDGVSEFHLTAPSNADPATTFNAIAELLREHHAAILSERIFASAEAFKAVDHARHAAFGPIDDGVPPTRLLAPGDSGIAGIQIHAVKADALPELIELDGRPCGRVLHSDTRRWIAIGGLSGGREGSPAARAAIMFELAERALVAARCTFDNVARTWLWLGDILSWYDELNIERNAFFKRCGLISAAGSAYLPASTGIGVFPVDGGGFCSMDLVAVTGSDRVILPHEAAGQQRSAFEYGSAFSRATTACTPAGRTLFVSGTAAIDDGGASEHAGNPQRQIEATLAHVRALLVGCGTDEDHILSATAYSANDEVRTLFAAHDVARTWPVVSLIGPICRSELLFEIEVTAALDHRPHDHNVNK